MPTLPRALLCLVPIALVELPAQSVVLNETFTSGDRSTQNPPTSLAWYQSSTTPANLTVKNGALDTVVANEARTVWAYFPAVTLNVGDSLTLTLEFSFTTPNDSGFRLALCNTNGVTPALSDLRGGPTGGYTGYLVNRNSIFKRDGPAASSPTSVLLDSLGSGATAIWSTRAGSAATLSSAAANTPYSGVLKITRTGNDTAVVTSSFTGGAGVNLTLTDVANIVSRFDTIAWDFVSNTFAGDLVVTRINLVRASTATITAQPVSRGVTTGASALFTAEAAGSPAPTFQWQRKPAGSTIWTNLTDSSGFSGATTSALLVNGVAANMDGDQFRVVATNGAVSATSDAAALIIVPANAVGRITNLSILTSLAAAPDDKFTMGYAVGGDGAKPLVIRAAGPSLGALGVSGAVSDPKMDFFVGATRSGGNDDWGGGADLATAMAGVGAFALSGPASKDAAALASIPAGSNSVIVSANASATGAVIAEIYDATPASTWGATTPRLINVSVLKPIGAALTAGFTLGGSNPKPVLIRAIGPSLTAFGVSGVLADPQLALFDGTQTVIAQSDDWGGTAALSAAFAQTGAFSLPASSKDAALIATLPPGGYTVRVTGVGNTTGTALVEIYELP